MRRHVDPLPAVAAGRGPFVVANCSRKDGGRSAEPSADSAGLFVAPLEADSVDALAIRQHEYGHLGLLRRGLIPRPTLQTLAEQGFHEYWVQGVLDVVVNAYMLAQGNREIAQLEMWTGPTPSERWIGALTYLRCEGMAVAPDVRPRLAAACWLTGGDVALLERVAIVLWRLGHDPRPVSVNQLSRLLADLQRTFGPASADAPVAAPPQTRSQGSGGASRTKVNATTPPTIPPPALPPGLSVPGDARRQRLVRRLLKLLARAARAISAGGADSDRTTRRPGAVGVHTTSKTDVAPGPMTILRPVLSGRARSNRSASRLGPGYSGAFRYPDRAFSPPPMAARLAPAVVSLEAPCWWTVRAACRSAPKRWSECSTRRRRPPSRSMPACMIR